MHTRKAAELLVDKEWPTRGLCESDQLMMSSCFFVTHRAKRYVMVSNVMQKSHTEVLFPSPSL